MIATRTLKTDIATLVAVGSHDHRQRR